MHRGKVQVLLATSRDTGRWIIPKGWPIDGLTPAQTAAQEAWEEAGVKGTVSDALIGLFTYDKIEAVHDPLPCVVSVFGVRVATLADKFPERKQRRRKWFDACKAARKVAEPDLRAILRQLDKAPATLLPETAKSGA